MIAIAPLIADDLMEIDTQPEQAGERAGDAAVSLAAGHAWTIRDAGGRIVACAGFREAHADHGIGWAELALGKGADMVAVTRAVIRHMDAGPYRRLTALVRGDFDAGHRWLTAIGFRLEGVHPGWGPAGETYCSYGRMRREVI